MSKRFSIRSLIIVMTFVALYFAVRRYFILFNDDGRRVYLIPPFFAVLAVVTQLCFSKERRLAHMIGIGATVSFVVAAALAIEIAEDLRSMGYWDWSTDYIVFLAIIGAFAIAGGVIGIVIGVLLSGLDRFARWIASRERRPSAPK